MHGVERITKVRKVLEDDGLLAGGALREWICRPEFSGDIPADQVRQVHREFGITPEQLAQRLIPVARSFAKASVSGYPVGAVVYGESGALYLGCNLEFPELDLSRTLHGEQSAVCNAWEAGETSIRFCCGVRSPCGHCLQFLSEIAEGGRIWIVALGSEMKPSACFLPDAFGAGTGRLLQEPPAQGAREEGENANEAALRAALGSYAPYSGALAGVAIQGKDGEVEVGRYAESIAFNPSVPALVSGLNQWFWKGREIEEIERVVLCARSVGVNHRGVTQSMCDALGIHMDEVVLGATYQLGDTGVYP